MPGRTPDHIPDHTEDRLIVALDLPTVAAARAMAERLDGIVSFFKLGLWLIFAPGFDRLLEDLVAQDKKVFLAIPAGFLIAAMVWLLPSAETSRFHVVTIVTYIIAIGGFSHIIVGSFEAFMLLVNLEIGLGTMLTQFTIPVLLGNVVGGTALFALLAYAQVMKEV